MGCMTTNFYILTIHDRESILVFLQTRTTHSGVCGLLFSQFLHFLKEYGHKKGLFGGLFHGKKLVKIWNTWFLVSILNGVKVYVCVLKCSEL